MHPDERLSADYRITGLTIGTHPMRLHREHMNGLGRDPRRGSRVASPTAAACASPEPSSAASVPAPPRFCVRESGRRNRHLQRHRAAGSVRRLQLTIVEEPFLLVEGILQNQRGSVSVKASRVEALRVDAAAGVSHDFHYVLPGNTNEFLIPSAASNLLFDRLSPYFAPPIKPNLLASF